MSKKLIATILISSAFVSFLAYIFYQTFYKYQPDVDQILAEIPSEDKELHPNILKVFRNTREINGIEKSVTTNILININTKKIRLSNIGFIMHHFIWSRFLTLRIGEKEVFAFYANKANLKSDASGNYIEGFKNGAKAYFKKEWQDLTDEEILVLLTISNPPSSFSRKGSSEHFYKKLQEFVEINHNNSVKSFW